MKSISNVQMNGLSIELLFDSTDSTEPYVLVVSGIELPEFLGDSTIDVYCKRYIDFESAWDGFSTKINRTLIPAKQVALFKLL